MLRLVYVCFACERACASLCLLRGPSTFVSDFGTRFDEVAVDSGHSSNHMQMTSSFIRETEINCYAIHAFLYTFFALSPSLASCVART